MAKTYLIKDQKKGYVTLVPSRVDKHKFTRDFRKASRFYFEETAMFVKGMIGLPQGQVLIDKGKSHV